MVQPGQYIRMYPAHDGSHVCQDEALLKYLGNGCARVVSVKHCKRCKAREHDYRHIYVCLNQLVFIDSERLTPASDWGFFGADWELVDWYHYKGVDHDSDR